jgi:hypothetical protein
LKAIEGIAVTQPEGAKPVLIAALGDSASNVRVAAAATIGVLGLKDALPTLFVAFERRIAGAGHSIGKLAGEADLERILGFFGTRPFPEVKPILDDLLMRKDLGDKVKMRIVGQVQELATGEARAFLQALVDAPPEGVSGRVVHAARDAAMRITQ